MLVPNKLFIIGNWKMKPETKHDALVIAKKLHHGSNKNVQVVIAPPAVFLHDVQNTAPTSYSYATQDIYPKPQGSYNAEISPTQAKSVGCDYVIVGHSSRRAMGETNRQVNTKILSCLEHDLIPIVCIGEPQRDESGDYIGFLQNQITECFKNLEKQDFEHVIIAYEPLWAIGSEAKREASGREVEEVRILIEKTIQEMTGNVPVGRVTVVYGGSVDTLEELDQYLDVGMKGALIGRASIVPETFNTLVKEAQEKAR